MDEKAASFNSAAKPLYKNDPRRQKSVKRFNTGGIRRPRNFWKAPFHYV
jgi:hypothetical protein